MAPCPPWGLWEGEGPYSPPSAPPCPPEPAQVQSGAADLSGGGPAAPLLHGLLPPLGPPDSPEPPEGGQPPAPAARCQPMPAPLNCSPPQYLLGSALAAGGWRNPLGPPSPRGWMRGLGLPPGTQDSPGGRGLPKGMGAPRTWGHKAGGGAGPSGTRHRDPRGECTPQSLPLLPPDPFSAGGSWVCPLLGCCCTWVMCVRNPIKSFPPSTASSFLGCWGPPAAM